MSKPQLSARKKYNIAVKIADKIVREMAWIYANHEILKKLNDPTISNKFYNTYAGQVWDVIHSSTSNEILIAIARILTDRQSNVSSLKNLYRLIKDPKVQKVLRKNYTQEPETFDKAYENLTKELSKIDYYVKNHHTVKSLRIFRNNHLAHKAQIPYTGNAILKWGDENELISLLSKIITPLEHVILNSNELSASTRKNYEFYAQEFWESFNPEK